jgi:hypothetical protein
LVVADRGAVFLLVMDNTYKVPENAVMLNNYSHISMIAYKRVDGITLMGDPFTLLYRLWPSRQCHEVTLNDMLGMGVVQPEGLRSGEVVCRERVGREAAG